MLIANARTRSKPVFVWISNGWNRQKVAIELFESKSPLNSMLRISYGCPGNVFALYFPADDRKTETIGIHTKAPRPSHSILFLLYARLFNSWMEFYAIYWYCEGIYLIYTNEQIFCSPSNSSPYSSNPLPITCITIHKRTNP